MVAPAPDRPRSCRRPGRDRLPHAVWPPRRSGGHARAQLRHRAGLAGRPRGARLRRPARARRRRGTQHRQPRRRGRREARTRARRSYWSPTSSTAPRASTSARSSARLPSHAASPGYRTTAQAPTSSAPAASPGSRHRPPGKLRFANSPRCSPPTGSPWRSPTDAVAEARCPHARIPPRGPMPFRRHNAAPGQTVSCKPPHEAAWTRRRSGLLRACVGEPRCRVLAQAMRPPCPIACRTPFHEQVAAAYGANCVDLRTRACRDRVNPARRLRAGRR